LTNWIFNHISVKHSAITAKDSVAQTLLGICYQ